jgi:hypothetical protein
MAMTHDYRALAQRWFEDNWNRRREAVVDELLAPGSVGHMEGGDVQDAGARATQERIPRRPVCLRSALICTKAGR